MTEEGSLSVKQQRFLTALLATDNIGVAARTAGISERTAHRCLKLPEFQAELKAARKVMDDEQWAETMQQLKDAVPRALDTLKRHTSAKSVKATSGTQIRSAMFLIEKTIEMDQLAELKVQIDELKQLLLERGDL